MLALELLVPPPPVHNLNAASSGSPEGKHVRKVLWELLEDQVHAGFRQQAGNHSHHGQTPAAIENH